MAARRAGPRSLQSGITLVEALVALVVLAVGLIGIAALDGRSVATSRTALFRTEAITLASDIAERIRANRVAREAYRGPSARQGCGGGENAGTTRCAPDEMAADDLAAWEARIAETLPAGRGRIDIDAASRPPTVAVTLRWDDPTVSAPVSIDMRFQVSAF